jgi:uroporphyrinogen decarboxylase
MNPKENALRIIHFDRPEYIMRDPPAHWLSYTGCNHEGYSGGGHHLPVGSTWMDIWGTGWRREHEGVMGFPVIHPLANLPSALGSYRWPDPDDERICEKIYQSKAGWDQPNQFLVGQHRDTLWEKAYMLVGMEDLMVFFKTEPAAVKELFTRITDFQLGIARHYLKLGIELAECGDDLGTQIGLLLSPRSIQEFLIPQYRRLYSLYQQNNVLIEFHSCGHIMPLLETFIDLGIIILNPIQATANDLVEMRRITLRRLALRGGVNSALLVSGPPQAIAAEVKMRIRQLGKEGGYFCAPDQGMPWPADHENALDQAVARYGQYPLI